MTTWSRLGLVGLCLTLGLAVWVAQIQVKTELNVLGLEQQRSNTVSAMFVSNELTQALAQLDLLRDDRRVVALASESADSKKALADVFTTLMLLDPRLIQSRWIDATGQEQVRVDREGRLRTLSPDELQDKSDRDYFAAVSQLPPDTLWLSTIDLNEENGQVELPQRPTVRVASPLSGQRGFLILNYDAAPLIQQVYRSAKSSQQVGMLDHQGQWIVSPDLGHTFGLQLGLGEQALGLPDDVRRQLDDQSSGAVLTPVGLLSWAPVGWSSLSNVVQGPQLSTVSLVPSQVIRGMRIKAYAWVGGLWLLLVLPIGFFIFRLGRAQLSEQRLIRQQLEQEKTAKAAILAEAEKLSRSNRDLDAFAYAAAHDLRSPLRAISQYVGILKEDLGQISEENQGYLDRVQALSTSLDRMLKGLLQYSRIGRTDAQAECLELGPLVDSMGAIYLAPNFTWTHDLPHPVQAPKALVELILRNVLMNAAKHHHKNAGDIRVTSEVQGAWVTLFCQDDGPGIPEAHWEQVFSVFGKLGGGQLQEQDGLGLAMVRRAVESLGGAIWIKQSSDQGTTFAIRMPKGQPQS